MTGSDKPPPDPTPSGREARGLPLSASLVRPLFAVVLVVLIVALVMPGSGVRVLAGAWPGLAMSIRRLNWMWPGIDMFHASLFAVTGLLAALAYPYAGVSRLLLVLFVLAALTEYVQIWIPERSSSLLELGIDFAGAAAGVALGRLLGWLFKARSAATNGG